MHRLRVFLWLGLVMAACGGFYGCSSETQGGNGGRQPVAVEAEAVRAMDLVQAIDVVGTLEPKFAVDIKAEITATVAEVHVTEWVRVAKGTPLATLDDREAKAGMQGVKAALAQAMVAEERAQRELDRVEKLKTYGLATQQNLDDARSAREASSAATEAAKAQLTQAEAYVTKTVIRSPMDGVVAFRGVSVGDRVENMGGGPMFRIVDNRVLDLTVTVPTSRSADLRVGQRLQFTVDALPGRSFEGVVRFINPAVDAASRTLSLTAEVRNERGELRGGQFVKGQILLGIRTGVLQIPRQALLTWDVAKKTGEVYVIEGETVARRTVGVGASSDDVVEVTNGLKLDERIVTRGGFSVKPGDPIKVVSSEGA